MPEIVVDNDPNTPAPEPAPAASPAPISRRLMPFAPLVIAMLAQTALIGTGTGTGTGTNQGTETADHGPDTPAVCAEEIPTYQECHSEYPNGCSQAAGYDAYVNLLKNQLISPDLAPQVALTRDDYGRLEQSLPQGLVKNNHEQVMDELSALGDGHVVSLIGYLYYAKKGGKESSNCQLTEPTDIDYHIGIGFDPALAGKLAARTRLTPGEHTQVNQSSMIVEMTPHWRAQFKPAWSLDALAPVVGRQVRVVGQLLVDNEHFDPHDDCAFPGASPSCWRAGVWELHPVTRFQVCGTGACTETSGGWTDLEDLPTTLALISHGAAPAPPAPAASSTSGSVAPSP
jgi:hypothetical protein